MGNQYDWMHDPKYELFDDLNALYEITTPEQIHELLGDPIVLSRYCRTLLGQQRFQW